MILTGMTFRGNKELNELFDELPNRVQNRVMRGAMSAAANPIVKAARAKAPKRSGLTRKAIGKKVKTYRKNHVTVAIIGPRNDVRGRVKGKLHRPAKIAHLIERGKINRDGTVTPPRPFIRPAYEQNEAESLRVMRTKLGEGIEHEAAKGAA